MNGTATKAEVAAIVRQLTSYGARRTYHRNHRVEGRWGESDAHVVWTFIYPSAEDHARRNQVCRSIWIHEDLAEQFRPMGFAGENVGDNITVDWSPNYLFRAKYVSTNTLSKEAYLRKVLPLIDELKQLLVVFETQLLAVSRGQLAEPDFLANSKRVRDRIGKMYFDVSDMSFAPFECRAIDEKLESVVAHLDNICLYYSKRGLETWDEVSRLEQSLQQKSYAREELQHLEYEVAKVR